MPTFTETPTETPTLTETATVTLTETTTATQTLTETATLETPTMPPTPLPAETATPALTETPSLTPDASLIVTPTETATVAAFETATATALTPSPSPTGRGEYPPEAPLSVLFTETFDSGALYLWTLGPSWSLTPSEGGRALLTTADDPLTFVHNTLGDVVVQARVQFSAGMVRLSTRESAAGSYTLYLTADGQASLNRNGQPLASAVLPPPRLGGGQAPGAPWRIARLSAIGGLLRVSVDGVEVMVAEDPTPLPPGTFSFAGLGAGYLVLDDVIAWVPAENMAAIEPTISSAEILQGEQISAPAPAAAVISSDRFEPPLNLSVTVRYSGARFPTYNTLKLYSTVNGTRTLVSYSFNHNTWVIYDIGSIQNDAVSWSPDGRYVAFGATNSPYIGLYEQGFCIAYLEENGTLTVFYCDVQQYGYLLPRDIVWSPADADTSRQWLLIQPVTPTGTYISSKLYRVDTIGSSSTVIPETITSCQGLATGVRPTTGIDWVKELDGESYYYFGTYQHATGATFANDVAIYRCKILQSGSSVEKVVTWADLTTALPGRPWEIQSIPLYGIPAGFRGVTKDSATNTLIFEVYQNTTPTTTTTTLRYIPGQPWYIIRDRVGIYSEDQKYAPGGRYVLMGLEVYDAQDDTMYSLQYDLPPGNTYLIYDPGWRSGLQTSIDFSNQHRGLKAMIFWALFHELSEDIFDSGSAVDDMHWGASRPTIFLHTSPLCVNGNVRNNGAGENFTNWGMRHCYEDHRYMAAQTMLNGILYFERRPESDYGIANAYTYGSGNFVTAFSVGNRLWEIAPSCVTQTVDNVQYDTYGAAYNNSYTSNENRPVLEWMFQYLDCINGLTDPDPNEESVIDRVQRSYRATIWPQIELAVSDFMNNLKTDPTEAAYSMKHANKPVGNKTGVFVTCVGGCQILADVDNDNSPIIDVPDPNHNYMNLHSARGRISFVAFKTDIDDITSQMIWDAYDAHVGFVATYIPGQHSVGMPVLQRAKDGSGYQWITMIFQQSPDISFHCPRSIGGLCPW